MDGAVGPVLDVDWKNSNTFATSSSDKTIHVARVGDEAPLKSFIGHTDEINSIKWDPQGDNGRLPLHPLLTQFLK